MIDKEKEISYLKAEIEQLKKENEIKNGWISLITHDFKEAFSSLHWLLQALDNKSISEVDFYALLPRIKKDAKKNLQTISDTTDWIRIQQKGFKPQASQFFAIETYARLKLDFKEKLDEKQLQFLFQGDEASTITTDRVLLNFILKKILDNAIKYSHPERTIYFKISNEQHMSIISIIDMGIGINQENINNIFCFDNAVFTGTKGEIGSGLGLKIVQKFVHLIDGTIEIDSTEDEGTTVSISIPLILK